MFCSSNMRTYVQQCSFHRLEQLACFCSAGTRSLLSLVSCPPSLCPLCPFPLFIVSPPLVSFLPILSPSHPLSPPPPSPPAPLPSPCLPLPLSPPPLVFPSPSPIPIDSLFRDLTMTRCQCASESAQLLWRVWKRQ